MFYKMLQHNFIMVTYRIDGKSTKENMKESNQIRPPESHQTNGTNYKLTFSMQVRSMKNEGKQQ